MPTSPVDQSPNLSSSSALETRILEACPLCDGRELAEEPFEYRYESTSFPGARCGNCDFVFLRRQPVGESFRRMYDAQYFQSDYHCGHEDRPYFATEQEEMAAAASALAWIERDVPAGRILEVGCAGGYFLAAARNRGWLPTGVEISEEAARFAREKLNLDVRTGTLDSVRFDASSFDVVYMGDVLEHVAEPLQTLRQLYGLVRPGGLVVIAGPITINSLDRRLGLSLLHAIGRRKVLQQPPYHLSEFLPRTLAFALGRAGFQVVRIVQSKIPPTIRNVRHRPGLEHWAKFALDIPNSALTRWLGIAGDRAVAVGRRP